MNIVFTRFKDLSIEFAFQVIQEYMHMLVVTPNTNYQHIAIACIGHVHKIMYPDQKLPDDIAPVVSIMSDLFSKSILGSNLYYKYAPSLGHLRYVYMNYLIPKKDGHYVAIKSYPMYNVTTTYRSITRKQPTLSGDKNVTIRQFFTNT